MKNYIGLFFTGVGIGIFLGLSKSPILLQILVPILTVIAGLLSILSGQKLNENATQESSIYKNISPFPIMWMILGMVAGSYLGLLSKNYDIAQNRNLSADPQTVITQNSAKDSKSQSQQESSTVLFSIPDDICAKHNLCDLKGIPLICTINEIENPEIEEFLSKKELNLDSIKSKIDISCNCKK